MNVDSLTLRDSFHGDLFQLLRNTCDPYVDLTTFSAKAVKAMTQVLPQRFGRSLLEFRDNSCHDGVLLLRNMPIDRAAELGPTPPHGTRAIDKRTFVSEGVVLGIGEQIGRAFGRIDEFGGEVIHNISASASLAGTASSGSFTVDFGFHTERPAIKHPPDALVLSCLRSNDTAVTYVASFREANQTLPTRYRDLLRQPLFQLLPGETSGASIACWSECRAMLEGPAEYPHGRVDFSRRPDGTDRFRGVTKPAQMAAEALREAIEAAKVGVTLTAGDVLLLQNSRLAHARTRYDVNPNTAQRRWLQRVYLTDSLWKHRPPRRGMRVF